MSDQTLENRVEAETDKAVGEQKQDLGKVTGDENLVEEGRVQEAAGEIREGVAKAETAVDSAASEANNALDGK